MTDTRTCIGMSSMVIFVNEIACYEKAAVQGQSANFTFMNRQYDRYSNTFPESSLS